MRRIWKQGIEKEHDGRQKTTTTASPQTLDGGPRRHARGQLRPMSRTAEVRIGTAGWSLPRAAAFRFESAGTHLERYSRLFNCAEINSSFHRPHAAATYAKWGDSTPIDFRFAVKMPRTITHELALIVDPQPG
jgi:hypothetical protein